MFFRNFGAATAATTAFTYGCKVLSYFNFVASDPHFADAYAVYNEIPSEAFIGPSAVAATLYFIGDRIETKIREDEWHNRLHADRGALIVRAQFDEKLKQ